MEKEYSAGAVVFRKEKDNILFLLVYSSRNRIWGFPKGHLEEEETEKQAAVREIDEESSVKHIKFIDDFREEVVYNKISRRDLNRGKEVKKHSIYFLCETWERQASPKTSEISECRWADIKQARELVTFESTLAILEKAFNHING